MKKASKTNPDFQKQLDGKDLTFMLHTLDGKVARHFIVKNNRLESRSGIAHEPAFSIGFKDAAFGYNTMQAKNKQLAFMQGIQDKNIQIQGNTMLVMWFQGLMKYLMPRKPKPKADWFLYIRRAQSSAPVDVLLRFIKAVLQRFGEMMARNRSAILQVS